MATSNLVLPGVLFVGEDERARVVAHTGPAAGWCVPRGVLSWEHEVSVVARGAITEDIKRATKIVMPEEQIPRARMPLAAEAANKSPLVAVSSKIVPKLVELGLRVHTIGADRVTSSFYYIAEGGGEDPVRIEGDLVAAVGAMLGERADNAAIERVLDGLVDRMVRSLSNDRVTELGLELAAALPRAASDGKGAQDVDLEAFEKALAGLVGASEKYATQAKEIADKLTETNERNVDVPLFGQARKVSQGPFELTVGDKTVKLGTYERWVMSGPLKEPVAAKPAPKAEPASVVKSAAASPAPKAEPAGVKTVAASPAAKAAVEAKAASPRPADVKAAPVPSTTAKAASPKPADVKAAAPAPRPEDKPEEKKAEAKVEEKKAEEKLEAKTEAKVEEKKPEPKAEEKKAEEKKPEPKVVEKKADLEDTVAPKKKAADKALADEDAKSTVKTKKKTSEPPKPEPKSNTMLYVIVAALAAGGYAVWHFVLHH